MLIGVGLGAGGASCSDPGAGADAGTDAALEGSVDAPADVADAAPPEDAREAGPPLRLAGWSATRAPEYNLAAGSAVKALRAAIVDDFDVTWVPLTTLTGMLGASNANGIVLTTYAGTFGTIQPALDANEQAALRAFVDAGHFAIILLDNDGYGGPIDPWNDSLANPFGLDALGTISADGGYVAAVATPLDGGVHPILHGTPSFPQYYPGWLGTMADAAVTPTIAATNPSGPALVVLEAGALGPGSGIVVAFSDTGSFTDDTPSGLTPAARKVFVRALRYAAAK